MSYFVFFFVLDPHAWFPWTISKLICIWSKSRMISLIDSRVDKVDYYEICANIDIVATQALFVMEFLPCTVR